MNVIGERVEVTKSADPTKAGISGVVVLETARMLLVKSGERTLAVEKAGSELRLARTGESVQGASLSGRLEDRWGSGR